MKMPLPATTSADEEFQMAPMIDMVFLLLVFFMVASNLNQADRMIIDVPLAKNAVVPEDLTFRRTISILPAGKGEEEDHVYMGLTPIKNLSVLQDQLEVDVARYGEKMRVYIRADRNVRHKKVREVMKTCAEAGAANIIFATLQTEAGRK